MLWELSRNDWGTRTANQGEVKAAEWELRQIEEEKAENSYVGEQAGRMSEGERQKEDHKTESET